MVLTMAEALEGQDSGMMREENRLASFVGWPINEGLCIPANVSFLCNFLPFVFLCKFLTFCILVASWF